MEVESLPGSEQGQSLMDLGVEQHGCAHYRRRCRIRAPCCNEIFDCRHCHNEAKNSLDVDPLQRHEIPRHDVKKVICSICDTEQDVQQNCSNCGVCLGKYFCEKCKFFDDNVSKNQYHCDGCGICRTGGRENFFHCNRCGCCYSQILKDSHRCVEKAMHHNCPICFEYLFESTKDISVLPCGHTIHLDCLKEMGQHFRYSCPVCSKSVWDMSGVWKKLDEDVASTPMPEMYQNKMVSILCNDCVTSQMYISTFWLTNALVAVLTIPGRRGAVLLHAGWNCRNEARIKNMILRFPASTIVYNGERMKGSFGEFASANSITLMRKKADGGVLNR